MSASEWEDSTIYKVVVNHEEQYSIWPADRANAQDWRDASAAGRYALTTRHQHGELDGW